MVMVENYSDPLSVPNSVQDGLNRFVEQMVDILGDQIVSIVLYGVSANTILASADTSPNVMVLLKEVTVSILDDVTLPVQVGNREYGLSTLLLSEDELRRSTDVFPIKFLDMQRRHRLLHGKDILSDLQISREHLRLRCEQEIKNLMLRLHQFYLLQSPYFERIEKTLIRNAISFISNLNVLVELATGTVAAHDDDILEKAVKLEFDVEPIRKCLALRDGKIELATDELKELYDSFMRLVQQAADRIDSLQRAR